MKQKKGFVLRNVCGENVIIGEGIETIDFRKLIALNDTAAWLWRQSQEMGDFSIDSLADSLCEHYDVSREQARADVERIVSEWTAEGLVEADE